MAKRGTLDHPKTLDLARRLKVEAWAALGLLEALWHWAGKYAPTGDLTEVEPRSLAEGMRVRRSPRRVLDALTESRWLDVVDGRTYIHDWPDHADEATKKALQRSQRTFAPYYSSASRIGSETASLPCRDTVETVSPEIQTHRAGARPGSGSGRAPEVVVQGKVKEGDSPDLFAVFWRMFEISGKPLGESDKILACRDFVAFDEPEQQQIITWVGEQLQTTWREPRYTPLPVNALTSKGWRRKAETRTIPVVDPKRAEAVRLLRKSLGTEAGV